MNVVSVEVTTLPASTVQEVLMVMLLKIIVAPATMTVQMIVSKIVLVHGVVISYLMNVASVEEITIVVQIAMEKYMVFHILMDVVIVLEVAQI